MHLFPSSAQMFKCKPIDPELLQEPSQMAHTHKITNERRIIGKYLYCNCDSLNPFRSRCFVFALFDKNFISNDIFLFGYLWICDCIALIATVMNSKKCRGLQTKAKFDVCIS